MRTLLKMAGLLFLSLGIIPASGFAKDAPKDAQIITGPTATSAIKFTSIDGKPMPLSDYAGKTLLIVNTASKCGFTPQYAGLQKLYETYKDRGLVVIGVPSNDFADQEPGSAEDIKKFTFENYAVTFPLTQKEVVSGENAHPFFQKVRADLGVFATPKWNFYKYLVTPEGKIVGWWSSKTKPDEIEFVQAIEASLPRK